MIYPNNVLSNEDIIIFDTTLRDGEQSDGCGMTKDEKEAVAKALIKAKPNVIEAGFPTSTQTDFDNVQNVSRLCSKENSPAVAALTIANKKSIEKTFDALSEAYMPCVHIFCATSPIHMEKKLNKTPEQVYQMSIDSIKHVREIMNGKGYIEFSAEDATRSNFDFLVHIVEGAIDAGARVINLPDTVGYATMPHFKRMIQYVQNNVRNINRAILSVHCHNDNDLALANSLNAIELGVKQIETTVIGIGERAGNVPLHTLIFHLENYYADYQKKVCFDKTQIGPLSNLVSKIVDLHINPKEPVIGARVNMHGAGIHSDGARKDSKTYEIFRQSDYGVHSNEELELGPRCGKAGVQTCLEKIGYTSLTQEQILETTQRVKYYADKIKCVNLTALEAIVDCEILNKGDYQINSIDYGRNTNSSAKVNLNLLNKNGVIIISSEGDGIVDAICKAINKYTLIDARLEDHKTFSLGKGSDTLGYVEVKVRYDGTDKVFIGKGIDLDLNIASGKAYLNAVCKIDSFIKSGTEC